MWLGGHAGDSAKGAVVADLDFLARTLGAEGIGAIAKNLGARPEQIEAALSVILPRLAQGMERNTLSRGGLADLVKAIGDGHHEAYLGRPDLIGSDAMRADGDAILAHVLGSNESARSLAQRAAATSGLSETIMRQLLPIVAAMLMGALAKATKGGLGDILSKIPGLSPDGNGPRPVPGAGRGAGGGMPRMPEPAPRSPGPAAGGDSPLPIPGDTIPGVGRDQPNPYEDLSDVIRKGGSQVPGGGSLGGIVRDILGGVLGFRSKGVIGWLLRLIVMRWGWGLVQTILRRLLAGR